MPEEMTFLIEDARIMFRNFAGAKSQYNAAGDRNFAVVLDDQTAERMAADGWNVKWLEPRDEGDTATPYISVKVSFKGKPPRITLIAGDNRTLLDEDSVDVVDIVDIKKVDLMCRAYHWEVNEKSGIKAYLKTMFVTVDVDPLEAKYGFQLGSSAEDG